MYLHFNGTVDWGSNAISLFYNNDNTLFIIILTNTKVNAVKTWWH